MDEATRTHGGQNLIPTTINIDFNLTLGREQPIDRQAATVVNRFLRRKTLNKLIVGQTNLLDNLVNPLNHINKKHIIVPKPNPPQPSRKQIRLLTTSHILDPSRSVSENKKPGIKAQANSQPEYLI